MGPANQANVDLLQGALDRGLPLLSLRQGVPPGLRVNGEPGPRYCADATALIASLETFSRCQSLSPHAEEA